MKKNKTKQTKDPEELKVAGLTYIFLSFSNTNTRNAVYLNRALSNEVNRFMNMIYQLHIVPRYSLEN